MVYIAPLTVSIGEGTTERQVTLTRGYYIDKREVSARAYHECVAANGCPAAAQVISIERLTATPDADAGADAGTSSEIKQYEDAWRVRCNEPNGQSDQPVNCISYSMADKYCKSRRKRLPTEAEWEIAAQGAERRLYPWGNSRPDCERACVDKNADCRSRDVTTCALGSRAGDKTPTEIFDLGGNVAEWVVDGWSGKPIAGTDPRANPFARTRVVRGGDFLHNLDMLRSATRREALPDTADVWIGVRCAMDVPATP
jgi:serine/threonine-protein kinase